MDNHTPPADAARSLRSSPAPTWRLRDSILRFGELPCLMGIVNVTPDSFSDGGRFFAIEQAVEHGLQLAEQGAGMLDVGGESTRPGAEVVDEQEELRRVIPVIRELCKQTDVPVSVDTSKASIAEQACDVGAQVINDVTGLTGDKQMASVAQKYHAGVCAMHMQGTPRTMQQNPQYGDVVAEISAYLRARRDALITCGIDADRICLDPGIGFGKTFEHNLRLIRECHQFHDLGCPVLIGHSRKGFLQKMVSTGWFDRDEATVGVALALAVQRIQVIRVHEVGRVRIALESFFRSRG